MAHFTFTFLWFYGWADFRDGEASEVTTYRNMFIIIIIFIPQVVKIPGVKNEKAKMKMSDGRRSGRSTGRVSCKSTELKRCSVAEMRWNKYEVSLASPV